VPGEADVDDNRFVDGVVRIKPWVPPPAPPVECVLPKWLLAFLFLLAVRVGACLVLLIGLALWCMHERKKEVEMKQLTALAVKPREESPSKISKTCSVWQRISWSIHFLSILLHFPRERLRIVSQPFFETSFRFKSMCNS